MLTKQWTPSYQEEPGREHQHFHQEAGQGSQRDPEDHGKPGDERPGPEEPGPDAMPGPDTATEGEEGGDGYYPSQQAQGQGSRQASIF